MKKIINKLDSLKLNLAQSLNCLLYKHEDPCLDLPNTGTSHMWWWSSLLTLRRKRQTALWSCPDSQSSKSVTYCSVLVISHYIEPPYTPYMSICMHTPTHTCTSIHICYTPKLKKEKKKRTKTFCTMKDTTKIKQSQASQVMGV